MTESEEEETTAKPRGRANAYFADKNRKPEPDNMTGSYRGVPSAPHGGQVTVKPEDVIGDIEYCWCGALAGHSWPGKSNGAPHPKEGTDMNERIERRNLSGYHSSLQEFILKAVNEYGLRYRERKNAIYLYPPDGSTPMNVHRRSTDRQIKTLGQWWKQHCAPFVTEPEKAPAHPDQLVALAQKMNDPVEHPDPPKAPAPAPPKPAAPVPAPPVVPEQAPVVAFHQSNEAAEHGGEWRWQVKYNGEVSDKVLTNDAGQFKCKDCDYISETGRGVASHWNLHHGEQMAKMVNPETRERAVATLREKRRQEKLEAGLSILIDAIGYEVPAPAPAKDERAEARIKKLEEQVAKLTQERDDAKARLALIKESLSA